MIASLTGTIQSKAEKYVVLEVHGVGYKVFVPEHVVKHAKPQTPLTLYTHLVVREDAHELYGFTAQEELELFEQLLTVPDVGPKSALGILSVASLEDVTHAISHSDASILTKVSGIGNKTAEKIIIELKDKVRLYGKGGAVDSQALDALVSLGYTQREARRALMEVPKDAKDVSEKVRAVLKILGKK